MWLAVDPTSVDQIPNYEGAFLKMFLTLGVLLVAIFGAIWLLKRLSNGRLLSRAGSRTIQILERQPLSPKTMLYLIEVEGKKTLIAESQLEVKVIASADSNPS